jgi:quinol---cytochrome c reductase iron-sulfur subunit, bacillus type
MDKARRLFLQWLTLVGSFLSTALVGVPSLRAFLSPAFRKPEPKRWIKLGEVSQIEQGVPIRFDFAETVNDAWVETRALRGVWIYTEDGDSFTVYNGQCTHLGCSYGFEKDKHRFHCPCHHGLFDLASGRVLDGPPPRPLDRLETRIDNGILFVAYQSFRAGVPQQIPVA